LRRAAFFAVLVLAVCAVAADEKKPLSRIGFGSCMHQDKPQPIWGPLVATKPELFLFLGDNIYADTEDIAEMRKMYAQLGAQEGFKKLKKQCPLLATWDDHDLGRNDVGAEYPKKKESQEAFLDFFEVPKSSPRRKREGVYHAEVFGPVGKRVQVVLLDTRYHRSALKVDRSLPRFLGQYVPNNDPKATVLGEAQWKWLEEQLKVPAEVRLIGSSIQFVANEHHFEKWGNFPRERERFLELVRKTKANGVVILSGDRHLAELSVLETGVGYPLYDITSSGLNQANKRYRKLEPNRNRVAIQDIGNNFGMVRIDWSKEGPQIGLEIYDEEGDVTIRLKLPLSRLQARGKATAEGEPKGLLAEAMKQVGKEWTVTFTVGSVGNTRSKSMYYLNSEKDFRSEKNFPVVLDMKALKKELKDAGITDPKEHFGEKKITVTGKVTLYREKPQIMVKSLKQIKVAK
jgi:alkaline phosphatase D